MAARYLFHEPADGPWNMAVDESLLATAAAGLTTLRIYSWRPATLSLGYFQTLASRQSHPASQTCPLVRRASGGGAILHDHELTYSFAAPAADRFDRGAEEIYDLFHHTLIATLADWQINAAFFRDTNQLPPAADPFLCFQRRSPNDLVVDGCKIMGSAQRRHQGALLQHGSLLLAQSPFAPELPGIAELSGQTLESQEIVSRWLPRLGTALGIVFETGELTAAEQQTVETWQSTRFATSDWNARR